MALQLHQLPPAMIAFYTERYMQTPQENASGYDENSPINHGVN
jgi:dipeptidyl aminopeptidase/acylaminoacyl peptidase